jgi:hypothetical protein
MLWEVKGRPLSPTFLGDVQPETVLFEYEGPRSFLARDPQGGLLFAHQCGESNDVWRYAVVPFSDRLAQALENGRLDLRGALDQPRIWIVDFGANRKPTQCIATRLSDMPEDYLPKAGVMLYPESEALPPGHSDRDVQPEIIERAGIISELDREEQTCLLRDDAGMTVAKLSFDVSLYDEVKDAFDGERKVSVAAKSRPKVNVAELVAVEFLNA